jgi:hypothetical protein
MQYAVDAKERGLGGSSIPTLYLEYGINVY